MPHLPLMQWDYRDQLQATAQQVVNNGGIPETTYYVYDASGQRVRKVTERQAAAGQIPTRVKERIYLGGFEIYREYENDGNTVELERETLHIMDDQQRIALVETRTQGNDPAPGQLIRYQFGNHLGSASLELDDQAQIISYEEYTPYGSTSYQAVRSEVEVSPKRYRYTGKERDEETGLYYHGARYYAAWLGRWTSCDPVGMVDGENLFEYAASNPVSFHDSSGTQIDDPLPEEWERMETTGPGEEAMTPPIESEPSATGSGLPVEDNSRSRPPFIYEGPMWEAPPPEEEFMTPTERRRMHQLQGEAGERGFFTPGEQEELEPIRRRAIRRLEETVEELEEQESYLRERREHLEGNLQRVNRVTASRRRENRFRSEVQRDVSQLEQSRDFAQWLVQNDPLTRAMAASGPINRIPVIVGILTHDVYSAHALWLVRTGRIRLVTEVARGHGPDTSTLTGRGAIVELSTVAGYEEHLRRELRRMRPDTGGRYGEVVVLPYRVDRRVIYAEARKRMRENRVVVPQYRLQRVRRLPAR
jgi:RHS repeat-associated protein